MAEKACPPHCLGWTDVRLEKYMEMERRVNRAGAGEELANILSTECKDQFMAGEDTAAKILRNRVDWLVAWAKNEREAYERERAEYEAEYLA